MKRLHKKHLGGSASVRASIGSAIATGLAQGVTAVIAYRLTEGINFKIVLRHVADSQRGEGRHVNRSRHDDYYPHTRKFAWAGSSEGFLLTRVRRSSGLFILTRVSWELGALYFCVVCLFCPWRSTPFSCFLYVCTRTSQIMKTSENIPPKKHASNHVQNRQRYFDVF